MSGEVMANSDGAAIDDLDVLDWFEHAELAQAITTRGQIKTIAGARGVTKYYTDNRDE